MITIPMHVSVSGASIPMAVSDDGHNYRVGIGSQYSLIRNGNYSGPYTFTPSDEDQIIQCDNLVMQHDITIAAIPDNYGKITWDGSIITVS